MAFESCTFILATNTLHLAQAFFVEASGIPHAGFAHMSVCTSQNCSMAFLSMLQLQPEWRQCNLLITFRPPKDITYLASKTIINCSYFPLLHVLQKFACFPFFSYFQSF